MPYKPKRPCEHPGCNKLSACGYCDEHKKEYIKEYNKYHRGYRSNERYNYQWSRIRERYVKSHPLCEECLKEGRYTPVEEVHHILPLSVGGTNDFNNLMSLCRSCHLKKHFEMNDRS